MKFMLDIYVINLFEYVFLGPHPMSMQPQGPPMSPMVYNHQMSVSVSVFFIHIFFFIKKYNNNITIALLNHNYLKHI